MKDLRTPAIFVAIILGASFALHQFGFNQQQNIASCIFLSIVCGTLFYWRFRVTFAFAGIAILLATNLLDVPHVIEHAGLDIILFLVGMMCMIGLLEEKHFFEYLVAKVVDRIGEKPYLLFGVLMLFAAVSAAIVDEVTSILFMMSTTFHLTKRYKVNPIPFLLMIVFATNIGSSATAIGNPIGVMIAMRGNMTMADFLRWASPISAIGLSIAIPLSFYIFRNDFTELGKQMKKRGNEDSELSHVRFTKKDIRICWIIFALTVTGLILHAPLEKLLHLQKNAMLLGVALASGSVAILLNADNAREFFMKRVDWWTLTFFMALFASVGTLKYVGVTERVAQGMIGAAGGDPLALYVTFSIAISLLTGFMDNVLAVATFIPILADIEKSGIFVYPFWWAMLFGGTFYGNLTVIGSTANIVAMGMLEKEYKQHIGFMQWMKPGVVVSTITLAVALTLVYLQIPLMPR